MNKRWDQVPNYYEELGISAISSQKELQKAFRRLARMLHPDLQRDETSRRLAESQIKRLNAIRTILLHPATRKEYDLSLQGAATPHPPPQTLLSIPECALTRRPAQWPWWAALFLLAVCLVAYSWPPAIKSVQAGPAISSPPLVATRRGLPANRRLKTRDYSSPHTTRSLEFEPVPQLLLRPELEPPDLLLSTPVNPPAQTADPALSLAGHWLSSAAARASLPTQLYAPEYAQIKIEESEDNVTGSFEAKYRVPDRPIFSMVKFRFSGVKHSLGKISWEGRDGSAGTLSLTQNGPYRLQLVWTADTLGSELSFISGSANLIRLNKP